MIASIHPEAQPVRAVVFPRAGEVELGSFHLCPCGPRDVLARTLCSMVSPGTELRMWSGAGQAFPVIPGYASVGEIVAVGAEVRDYRPGDLVSGRSCPRFVAGIGSPCGGHLSHQVYPATGEDRPVLLPPGADPLDYAVAEIAAISLRGVAAAAPRPGETAIVLGLGLIGALSAAWLAARGCRVVVSDFDPGRLARAAERGAAAAVLGSDPDAEERLFAWTDGGADIVVESSGAVAGFERACRLVAARPRPRPGSEFYKGEPIARHAGAWPRLVVQATHTEKAAIRPDRLVAGEGVVVLGPRDRGLADRLASVEGLRRGEIAGRSFLDRIVRPEEALAAYAALRGGENRPFSVVFDWRSGADV